MSRCLLAATIATGACAATTVLTVAPTESWTVTLGLGDADEGVHERSLGSPWTAAAGTASMSAGRRAMSSSMPARSTTASNAITGVKEAADHVLEVAKTEMKQRADDLGEGT